MGRREGVSVLVYLLCCVVSIAVLSPFVFSAAFQCMKIVLSHLSWMRETKNCLHCYFLSLRCSFVNTPRPSHSTIRGSFLHGHRMVMSSAYLFCCFFKY